MMKKLLFLLLASCIIGACKQQSEYEQWVQTELEKGVRHDSLFLGYKFGMEKEEFFEHSWELNQKHIVTGRVRVEHELQELSSPARMVFYPDYHNGRIYRMPVEISFKAWAPWNSELWADSLLVEVVDFYGQKYGEGFKKMKLPDLDKESWVKIDGNRRIAVFAKDNMKVRAEFLDLSVQKQIDQQQEE